MACRPRLRVRAPARDGLCRGAHRARAAAGEFVTALVAFNAGVESGQLLVIAAAFALVGWHQARPSYRGRVALPASLAIACVAVYWTIERATLWR